MAVRPRRSRPRGDGAARARSTAALDTAAALPGGARRARAPAWSSRLVRAHRFGQHEGEHAFGGVAVLARAEPFPEPVVALAVAVRGLLDVAECVQHLVDRAEQRAGSDLLEVEVELPQVTAVVVEVVGEVE